MELTFIVYLASVVENFRIALSISVFVLLVSLIIIGVYIAESQNTETGGKLAKKVVFAILSILSLLVFIPSERTMWVMAGAYATQQVTQSKEAFLIYDKLNQVIHQKLDQFLTQEETAK